MPKTIAIIPARYASMRLPGKPLRYIGDKTMIQRVYEQACKATLLSDVIIATDHQSIASEVEKFGGKAIITSTSHPSGTDRCYEAFLKAHSDADYILNIQGDEPFIAPEQIDELLAVLDGNTEIATQIKKIDDSSDIFNPNTVKVVRNTNHEALYFSRQAIPFQRNQPAEAWLKHHDYYRHIGIYAYRADILTKITSLPVGVLEQQESLEQLRWLENGYRIRLVTTQYESIGIDTEADLEKAAQMLQY